MVVAGAGPHLDNYRQQAQSLGIKNITFTGFIEKGHVPAAYYSCDIFASASDSETFGLTFVEAMACGIPVVGVRKLGPKEIIDNGVNGFLVRPGSSAQMSKKLGMLLEDEEMRKRMGKAAKEKAVEFSLEKSLRDTLRIYAGLAGKKK